MTHYMRLNPEPFDKIASGRKTIELRLYDEKRKLVKPNDEIIFTHIQNPCRSISVIVDSVITAASFESLFKHISLVDCGYDEKEITGSNHLDMNQYYTEDNQKKYGVCGIRFSLNSDRALSDIQIPICEVQKHLIKMLAEEIVVSDAYEWYRWHCANIDILTNEKYKGDAILNKTYIRDCLSKKVMVNNGERPKYYVENNHPAIIDSGTFGRVQEEKARRGGKRKVKQVGTKTEQGRYSSKYALTELLICGECGTPYRRCTWAANGKKKIVWRCINRLDYGKKYCHNSPSIEESVLQEAIMKAVMQTAKQNAEVLKTLKLHIGMSLSAETTEDNSLDLQIRIAEIEAEFQKMLKAIAADNVEAFDEEKAKALMDEKAKLQIQLDRIADTKQKRENAKSRLDEIFTIIEALANHPISYDDQIVRQILESVIVESKEKIKVVFVGGLEVTQLM